MSNSLELMFHRHTDFSDSSDFCAEKICVLSAICGRLFLVTRIPRISQISVVETIICVF